jgi:hypothetical protein
MSDPELLREEDPMTLGEIPASCRIAAKLPGEAAGKLLNCCKLVILPGTTDGI